MTTTRDRRSYNGQRSGAAAALQAEGKCVDCERPSKTQRCIECSRRVEKATNRYRGQGKRGRATKGQVDLVDMKHIGEAWSRALTSLMEIERAMPMSAARLDEKRSVPLHDIGFINRQSAEILKREGYPCQTARMDVATTKKKRKPTTETLQLSLLDWKAAA